MHCFFGEALRFVGFPFFLFLCFGTVKTKELRFSTLLSPTPPFFFQNLAVRTKADDRKEIPFVSPTCLHCVLTEHWLH